MSRVNRKQLVVRMGFCWISQSVSFQIKKEEEEEGEEEEEEEEEEEGGEWRRMEENINKDQV